MSTGPMRPGRLHRLPALLAPAALAGAILLLCASPAAASPATLRVIDAGDPSLGTRLPVAAPGGGTFSADPGRVRIATSAGGGPAVERFAWCVDRTATLDVGADVPVDLQTGADAVDLRSPGYLAAGWLMSIADGLVAAAPDQGREAAAVQVAIWRLTGQAADVVAVTPDDALDARADALRRLADGKVPVTGLALDAPAGPAAPGAPATLRVTGTPGAPVALAVRAGSAALATPSVTLGADGTAVTTVTPSAPGAIRIAATAQGGTLTRLVRLPGARTPQSLSFLVVAPIEADASLTAIAPAVVPPAPPVPVIAAATGTTLRLQKDAPGRVRLGAAIPYTLTIINRGRVAARNVVVRDPVPAGTSVGRLPARARLEGGAVVWHLGRLAPGARVTVHLRLLGGIGRPRLIVNRAGATAANARAVHAVARTSVIAPRRVAPAVVRVTG